MCLVMKLAWALLPVAASDCNASWAGPVADRNLSSTDAEDLYRRAAAGLVQQNSSALKSLRRAARLAAAATFQHAPRVFEERVDCLRPSSQVAADKRRFDEELLELRLEPGRRCVEGDCGAECGVLVLDEAISAAEAEQLVHHAQRVKELHLQADSRSRKESGKVDLDFAVSARHGQGEGHILFMYVLERLRCLIALAAKVPRSWVHIASHFLSYLVPDPETGSSKGTVHCDESSFERFHFSAVLWLTEQSAETGGELQFWDAQGMWRATLRPARGRVALFTSGWENIHRVTPLTTGERWSLPVFASLRAPFNATRLVKACLWPKNSKQLQYCEERQHWLSAPDEDIA